MNRTLLIEQFKKYSPKEIRDFGEYLNSPFFNKNQSVIKLYEYIKKQYPQFDLKKMEKKIVYSKIFPNADYNDGFMRTVIFNLSRLADDFLAYQRFNENHFARKWYLLHTLNEKCLDRQIEKTMKELSKELSCIDIREADYYLNRFMIEYEYFYYLNRLNHDKIEKFINNAGVDNMFNNLTYFYLLRVIKHYDYYLNAREICRVEFKTEKIEDIIKNLNPEIYDEVPVIGLYYNVLMLHLKEDETSYFHKVKNQVMELEKYMNKYEIIDTYINLENYCKKKIRKGCTNFYNELFEILNTEIEKGIYGVQGKMSDKFFRITVETALKLGKIEWAKEFMEKYAKHLPPATAENTFNYASALYEFAARNFSKSLEFLSRVKYDDVYHKAEMRCLTAQLYFEMDMEESLYSHLDSFRHFLANDKFIPEERKEFFYNFIRIIKSLAARPGGKLDTGYFWDQISKTENLYNKEWFLQKAEELNEVQNQSLK